MEALYYHIFKTCHGDVVFLLKGDWCTLSAAQTGIAVFFRCKVGGGGGGGEGGVTYNNNNNNNRIQRRNSRFFTISSLRREASPTRTLKWPGNNCVQITCNTFSAYHVQHVVIRATWYEETAQL